MDFAASFLNSLINEPALADGMSPLVFLGRIYSLSEETDGHLLTVLSGGTIEAKEKYSFLLRPLACRMLLYTRRGCGIVRLQNRTYQLEEKTLLYLDCAASPSLKIEIASPLWQYTVFFFMGEQLSYLESLVPFEGSLLISVPPYSSILPGLEKLLSGGTEASLGRRLSDSAILYDILIKLWAEGFHLEEQTEKYPSWLPEIKQSLDTFFMNPFRLEDLEDKYHISKYRICREFSAAYGLPPLKYVNKRRIEAARNLLLSSDKHIHEIASETGFENTNHFINLFKKETGLTPLVYRNKSQ